MTKKAQTSLSLVLGSGGARGHAHIGVIRALEEANYSIKTIAGTSMGAVIGGMYAAGELEAYFDWARSLDRRDVIRLLDFSFSMRSLFKGERIIDTLRELIGERNIEDLPIGFTAVATDLDANKEYWLNSGPLFTAIRASTAVPTVFSPVELNGRLLVDGGLVNPIPIAPTLNEANQRTFAVNLAGQRELSAAKRRVTKKKASKKAAIKTPKKKAAKGKDKSKQEAIREFVMGLITSNEEKDPRPSAAEQLTQSLDIMQSSIARLKLAAYSPDLVINIPRDACSFFEFDRAEEMAELGYERARTALADLASRSGRR